MNPGTGKQVCGGVGLWWSVENIEFGPNLVIGPSQTKNLKCEMVQYPLHLKQKFLCILANQFRIESLPVKIIYKPGTHRRDVSMSSSMKLGTSPLSMVKYSWVFRNYPSVNHWIVGTVCSLGLTFGVPGLIGLNSTLRCSVRERYTSLHDAFRCIS